MVTGLTAPHVVLNRAAWRPPSLGQNLSADDLRRTALALLAAAEHLTQNANIVEQGTSAASASQLISPLPPTLSIRRAASRTYAHAETRPAKDSLLAHVGITLLDRIAPSAEASSSAQEALPDTPLDSDVDYKAWGAVIRRPIPSSPGCPSPVVDWPPNTKLDPLSWTFGPA